MPSIYALMRLLAPALLLICNSARAAPVHRPEAASPSRRPASIAPWIRAHAIRLDVRDRARLRELVGPARVVALGEAVHGAGEFVTLRQHFLKFLVEEMGFQALVIEANWPESLVLDQYVRSGKGDVRAGLRQLGFWTLQTEEMLFTIEWLRDFNKRNRAGRAVRFFGCDMQRPGTAAAELLIYLERAGDERPEAYRAALEAIRESENRARQGLLDSSGFQSVLAANRRATREIEARLVRKAESYRQRTGAAAWRSARRHAQILHQSVRLHTRNPGDPSPRDEFMATNVQWIREDLGPQARVVVWAHNEHVSLTQGAMGGHLRRAMRDDVLVVGSAFGQGSFLALPPLGSNPQTRSPDVHRVGPPAADSLEATLAAAGIEQFVLDLRGADAAVGGWFDEVRPMRMFGASVQNLSRLYRVIPSREFHAIAFVDRISPTHRLRGPGSAE